MLQLLIKFKFLLVLPSLIFISPTQNSHFSDPGNDFIAMEFLGFSNHIYKVVVTNKNIVGIEVNGYIAVENPFDIGTTIEISQRNDPSAYINKQMENVYQNVDLDNDDIFSINPRNFRIAFSDVKSAYLSPKKQWGMGSYPYSGRLIIKTRKTVENKKKRKTLILIGDQNSKEVLNYIKI